MKSFLGTNENLLGALQRVADILVIALIHWAARSVYGVAPEAQTLNATGVGALVFMLAAETNGLYRPWNWQPAEDTQMRTVVLSWLVVPVVLTLLAFSTKTSAHYSRVVSFSWFLLSPFALYGWRLGARALLRHLRTKGWNVKRVAILGAGANAAQVGQHIGEQPGLGMRVVGLFDDRAGADRREASASIPYLGNVAALVSACKAGQIDVVYVTLPLRAEGRTAEMLRALADTTATVYLLADFFTYELLCARWSTMGRFPVVSIYDTPFTGIVGWLKRVEDVLIGLVILALIAVPLLVIALAVKLTSPGPVFFRQRRYGLNGREIRVLKFRTMTVTEDGDSVPQARREDPRVTRLGRVLRRLSLDELPQFLQVITGEMSIVGPRPHAVAHNEEYRTIIQGYMLRHKVKPGITGWAQVHGWRGATPQLGMMEKRVQYDLEYIQNWSLALDLEIIFLTIFGRRKGRNAY